MLDPANEKLFIREFSWIEFNARVLAEAMEPANPLLERLKFTGIVSSNFDEFFMVRVASLKGSEELEQKVRQKAFELMQKQSQHFSELLAPELTAGGIVRVLPQALDERQLEYLRNFFYKELLPVLTPIAVSEDKPAPPLINLSLYMALCLMDPATPSRKEFAVVEIPRNFSRMISLPANQGYSFILLEDLLGLFAKELFSGYEIIAKGILRITRAAEMTLDEEKDEDFAKVMSEAIRMRNRSEIVRLEVSGPKAVLDFFKQKLEVNENKIFDAGTWLDLKSISQLAFLPMFTALKRPAWQPRPQPDFERNDTIWELLKKKDVWIFQPYESFDAVTRFIAEAAADPDVLAIKQTLYRTSGPDSPVIKSLEKAAEKGKRVTVLLELKARFDEEKNIEWARRLEIAGATLLYGVVGLKTHAKVCLVVRREPDGIKRYAHLSTGNYNEKTAQIYSDIGFFTSNEEISNDLSAFFNMITGFSHPASFAKIDTAPFGLRREIKRLITREAIQSSKERPGLIMVKMNSLVDPEIIQVLYEASQAGVHIKLNVRGICCLRPGIKGLSENIEVTSVVDMFLEHSRMIYFRNGGDEELYLSSADWMPRNLDRRIEIMWPVENKEIRNDMIEVLKAYFKDNTKAWRLTSDGEYQKIDSGDKKFRVQDYFCRKAEERDALLKQTAPAELKPQMPRAVR